MRFSRADIPHIVLPRRVSLESLVGSGFDDVMNWLDARGGVFLFDPSDSKHIDGSGWVELTVSFAPDSRGKEVVLSFDKFSPLPLKSCAFRAGFFKLFGA